MRVSDYVYAALKNFGVNKVFTLTGGGAMFLNDAAALAHPEVESIFCHHEQAAAMAATAHAKYTGLPSAVSVTTGCGSTNAITGLLEAWQDNVPVIFVSGQVNLNQTTTYAHPEIKNLGVQEANIVDIVKSITKYATMICSVDEVVDVIHEAFEAAVSGRKGPVWIDIPMDIQGAQMPADAPLPEYDPKPLAEVDADGISELCKKFSEAKRPVILAGNGVALAGAAEHVRYLATTFDIPVVTTYLSADLFKEEDLIHVGTVGIKGSRAANFAMQNADLLLVIGCRLSVPVTGYDYSTFAREANVVVVDIDKVEHSKDTVRIDQFINMDAKEFASRFLVELSVSRDSADNIAHRIPWRIKCLKLAGEWSYLGGVPDFDAKDQIDLYSFLKMIKDQAPEDAVYITDTGSPYYAFGQAMHFKGKQRYITSSSQACMGFALPAIVGVGAEGANIISIIGDGSFQLNIQELQTIRTRKINVKIFVVNNGVYLSIRSTQLRYFDRVFGTGDGGSVEFPPLHSLAATYGFAYRLVDGKTTPESIKLWLESDGPMLIEVRSPKDQPIIPMLTGKQGEDGKITAKPLEDMYPFLDREEFYSAMDIKPLEEL